MFLLFYGFMPEIKMDWLIDVNQRSSALSVSSRRPPVAPRLPLDLSRSTSLPPSASGDILHRRRTSISSVYNVPVRVSVHRHASPAPPSVSTIRQGESPVTAYRRASYSGASPNYRSHTVSRHTTPDRSALYYWQPWARLHKTHNYLHKHQLSGCQWCHRTHSPHPLGASHPEELHKGKGKVDHAHPERRWGAHLPLIAFEPVGG